MFDNTSECYKFFWFKAIVTKIVEGKATISYDELIDDMIADAWYMVTEYHLNLGPKDTLEALVVYMQKSSRIKSSDKREVILEYLKNTSDLEIRKRKRILTYNVTYRLQAPFMEGIRGDEWKCSESDLVVKIKQEKRLMYYFSALNSMITTIKIQPEWEKYIIKNQEIVKGWLEYKLAALIVHMMCVCRGYRYFDVIVSAFCLYWYSFFLYRYTLLLILFNNSSVDIPKKSIY